MAESGWQELCADLRGKKVLVLGLGTLGGGEGVARALSTAGALVRVTDQKSPEQLAQTLDRLQDVPLERSLGHELLSDVEWADLIVKNPSVPVQNSLLLHAVKLGKHITNEAALFLRYTKTKTIGITGTRGKSTTSAMMHAVMRTIDPQAALAGNIPGEPCLPLLEHEDGRIWTVLELSSFQLEGCHDAKQSPHASIVTNLYPDHLNRYSSMEAYAEAKAAILAYQTKDGIAVLSKDNPWTPFFQRFVRGTFAQYSAHDLPLDLVLRVPGEHNRENAAAVLTLATLLGVPLVQARRALEGFVGVPFRLQTIATIRGVRFVNDTTSTTPVALGKALQSISGRLHLIIGGADKGLPLDGIVTELNEKKFPLYLLEGSGTERLRPLLDSDLVVGEYGSLATAVQDAFGNAQSGEAVVLSPGFASFGMFRNEFDRGNLFNEIVQTLG